MVLTLACSGLAHTEKQCLHVAARMHEQSYDVMVLSLSVRKGIEPQASLLVNRTVFTEYCY